MLLLLLLLLLLKLIGCPGCLLLLLLAGLDCGGERSRLLAVRRRTAPVHSHNLCNRVALLQRRRHEGGSGSGSGSVAAIRQVERRSSGRGGGGVERGEERLVPPGRVG